MSLRASEPAATALRADRLRLAGGWLAQGRRAVRRIVWPRPSWTVLVDADGVVAAPGASAVAPQRCASFGAWASAADPCRASLLVSGRLLHTLHLADAAGGDAARDAAKRFATYHGAAAATWPIAIDRRSGYACALHGADLTAIGTAAASGDIDLECVVPLWSEVLALAALRAPDLASAQSATLLVVEHTLVTCLVLANGALIDAQQRFLDAATPAALDDLHARLVAESALGTGETLLAGWGVDADVAGGFRLPLGPLVDRAERADWLFRSSEAGHP